jgi:hypothetical protein
MSKFHAQTVPGGQLQMLKSGKVFTAVALEGDYFDCRASLCEPPGHKAAPGNVLTQESVGGNKILNVQIQNG